MNENINFKKDEINDPFDNLRQPFLRFLRIESSGGILLIIATVIALIVANSGWANYYESFWKQDFT